MHARRMGVLMGLLAGSVVWGVASWVIVPAWAGEAAPPLLTHRIGSVAAALILGMAAWCVMMTEGPDEPGGQGSVGNGSGA